MTYSDYEPIKIMIPDPFFFLANFKFASIANFRCRFCNNSAFMKNRTRSIKQFGLA